jgi:microsomal dipeptidase-like Zn-dependent dipeptidase
VNTEMFGDFFDTKHPANTSDDAAITAEIDGMNALAQTCASWMKVCWGAAEARATIASGKLAVVLGVEVDSILGGPARWGASVDPARVDQIVNRWWAKGVRLMNPVHLADNAIGGSAIKDDRFNISNHYLRQKYPGLPEPHFFEAEAASGDLADVRFLLGGDPANNLLINAYGKGYPLYLKKLGKTGHANARGLSQVGSTFLASMIKRGMLIDVEHMSSHALDATLTIAEQRGYPLVSSHTGFRASGARRTPGPPPPSVPGCATEAMRSEAQLRRLKNLGSIIGIFGHVGPLAGLDADTSANWARAYHYLRNFGFDKIAIGTDMNGFAQAPGPRFKPGAIGLTHLDPHDGVRALDYGRDVIPFIQKTLVQSALGKRSFNYNTTGLAHYGLLPDFTMDVALQLQSPDTLETFFHSAEAFLSVWEKCESFV